MLSAPMVPVSRSSARAVVQLYATVAETTGEHLETQPHAELDKIGYVNQHGLSRKVDVFVSFSRAEFCTDAPRCSIFLRQ